ncbi:site-specific recombinase XerD [Lacinutrix venerupis]|uniref:tyrosine-type recombinase/integrase n=1 Tax=Lacinutrix venerupis TaxID=1486034 RepID=UPI000EB096F6|nr:site-specific integrase [Lacinutrix venerupis]RLJ60776.1 site-specific recombinase XerD [Lacinutrix venerupis]
MTKVALRRKKIANNMLSLYLDFYPPIISSKTGKPTRREFLNMKIFSEPIGEVQRAHNKKTISVAELIKSKRLIQLTNKEYGFKDNIALNVNFKSFFEVIAEEIFNRTSHKNHLVFKAALNYFVFKFGDKLKTRELNITHVNEFRKFLLTTGNLKVNENNRKKLSVNTASTYYKKFLYVLKEAYKRKLTDKDLSSDAVYIKEKETHRDYLDENELKTLWETPIKNKRIKHMAMLSALSGLRFVDIVGLKWSDIYNDTHQGSYIKLTEKKTQNTSNLPLSHSAIKIINLQNTSNSLIFPEIKYSQIVRPIKKWIEDSGINKKISFHNFRHSFATLQLANGTDIYTVSKLLGHKNVSTTQIYTKVIDRNKIEAINRINLNLDGL